MTSGYGDVFGFEPGVDVEENSSTDAFQTLLDNVNSDHPDKRHLAASSLAEATAITEDNEHNCQKVLQTLLQFAEDPETSVRRVLMAQLMEITNRLQDKPNFKEYLSHFIFPTFLKSSTDSDVEVRKSAHVNLLTFVKLQNLSKEQVNHLLVHATESVTLIEAEDLRVEIVSLMADLSGIIGQIDTCSYLLPTFLNLCLDTAFSIRKACAVNFGRICANIDQETFERDLLPKYTVLCQDSVWGVRKACTESFVDVAIRSPSSVRQELFVRLMLGLINDVSRWVRVSAYQALGPFISTFAFGDFNFAAKQEKTETLVAENSSSANSKTDDSISKSDLDTSRTDCSSVTAADSVSAICARADTMSDNEVTSMNSKGAIFSEEGDIFSASKINTLSDEVTDTIKVDPNDQLTSGTSDTMSVETDKVSGEAGGDVDWQDDDLTKASAIVEKNTVGESQTFRDIVAMTTEESVTTEEATIATETTVDLHERNEDVFVDEDLNRVECQSCDDSSKDSVSHDKTDEDSANNSDAAIAESVSGDVAAVSSLQDNISDFLQAKESFMVADKKLDEEFDNNSIDRDEGSLIPRPSDVESGQEVDAMISEIGANHETADNLGDLPETCSKLTDNVQLYDHMNTADIVNGQGFEDAATVNVEGLDLINEYDESQDSEVQDVTTTSQKSDSTSICTASVSEVAEPEPEVVRNIGSVHVHVKDQLNVVDGVVQPTENFVKINIMHQDIFTLQQDSLDNDVPKTEEKICRANVIHIPPESPSQNNSRPFLMKRCQGLSRFGFPLMPQRMAYYDDDSDVETYVNPEKSSLETANRDLAVNQSIVPCELLEQYLNMAEPSRAQTVDTDILKHCAFSLPAVAYTLGQKNWTCLQRLYRFLARNMQWQVRRTLALSIHKMALILGDDLIITELLPVFDELIKDLDEVRSGIVKNLSEFLQLLPEHVRICYLPKLENFLITETNTRWRYRQDFAQQLISLVSLFSVKDVQQYILPIAFVLTSDKVSEIRHSVMHLFSAIVKMLSEKEKSVLMEMLDAVRSRMLESSVWLQRQLYVIFSQSVLDNESLTFADFLDLLLPNLLKLREDPVPNVRITLGRFLSHFIMTRSDLVASHGNLHEPMLQETLEVLKRDTDQDVRHFVDPMTSRLLSIV